MDYFRMEVDRHFMNPIKGGRKESFLEGDAPFVWNVTIENGAVPDFFVISKFNLKYFCVSQRLKELLEVYADKFEQAVPFFPTDVKKKQQEFYWKIALPEEDFLVKRKLYSKEEPRLNQKPPFGKHCFQVKDDNGKYLIVSLPLAENLLREYFKGIVLVPILVKEGL